MLETFRKDFYWPHMANNAYRSVTDCDSCARMSGLRYKHQQKWHSSQLAGHWNFGNGYTWDNPQDLERQEIRSGNKGPVL